MPTSSWWPRLRLVSARISSACWRGSAEDLSSAAPHRYHTGRISGRLLLMGGASPSPSSTPQPPAAPLLLTARYVVGLLAFLICVDMTEVLGLLCYQLFTGTYFPWHVYPLMLNRAIELLALLCSDGHVPSMYSVAQVFLSVLSMVIYIQKQPCGRLNCVAALVLYGILISYQIFVAVTVLRISSIPIVIDDEGSGDPAWLQDLEGHHPMNGLSPTSSMMLRGGEFERGQNLEKDEVIVAVQQPDGEKFAIARLCNDTFLSTKVNTFHDIGTSQVGGSCHSFENEISNEEGQAHMVHGGNNEMLLNPLNLESSTDQGEIGLSSCSTPTSEASTSRTNNERRICHTSPLNETSTSKRHHTRDESMERDFLSSLADEIVSIVLGTTSIMQDKENSDEITSSSLKLKSG